MENACLDRKKKNNTGFIMTPERNKSQQNDAVVAKETIILRCINKK